MMFRSLVLLITLLLFAAPAFADDCSNQVVDYTGKANAAAIQSALHVLVSDGADPKVRIVTNAQASEAGNLDKLVANTLHRCAAWQSPGGNLKSNLLVLMVGPDMAENQVGIFFSKRGSLTALQGQTAAIRAEMGTKFKSDLTGAITAGIEALHSKLSVKAAAGAGTVNGNVTIINKGPEKPTNFTPFYILIILAIAGVGLWLFLRSKAGKARARGAQQSAQGKRAECNNLLLGFGNKMPLIGAQLSSVKSLLNEVEFAELQTRLGRIQSSIGTVQAQFSNLQGSANDPDSVGRTTEEYHSMTQDFAEALLNIKELDRQISNFEQEVREVKTLQSTAQPAIDALMTEIENATTVVAAEKVLKTDGPKATLQRAIALAERAQAELSTKSYKTCKSTCKEASDLAKSAARQVSELSARKSRVDEDIRQLDSNNPATKQIGADATISTLRTSHGEEAVTRATVHRATILQNIELRRTALQAAKSASFAQNWDLAEQQVSSARKAVRAIDDAVAAINDIGPGIDRAKAEAVRAAQQSASRYGSRSRSSSTVVNNTTVIYGRDPFGNPLDNLGNVIAAELLVNAMERDAWERSLERERDLDYRSRELDRRERENSRNDDYDYGRRASDDNDIGGDSGSVFGGRNDDDDIGGDSGSPTDDDDDDISSGDDD